MNGLSSISPAGLTLLAVLIGFILIASLDNGLISCVKKLERFPAAAFQTAQTAQQQHKQQINALQQHLNCAIIHTALPGCSSVWLECLLGVQEVACSSHVTPTRRIPVFQDLRHGYFYPENGFYCNPGSV